VSTGHDSQFIDIFRDEANERLDTFVETVLALESGTADAGAIDSLFRDAHTIKGGAGMLGLDEVRALAHGVEDVLANVRELGTFPLELAEPLLRAADALRAQVAGTGGAALDVLDALAEGQASLEQHEPSLVDMVGSPRGPSERRAIRVPAEKIDRLLDLVGETVLHRRRLEHVLGGGRDEHDESVSDELDHGERLLDDLKDAAIEMRTLPLSSIAGKLPRAVRDIAAELGKDVELTLVGAETELDRVILESLSEPLVHLLRNAVAHGIESPKQRKKAGKPKQGSVVLSAKQRGALVAITVADDGQGVPPDVLSDAAGASLVEVLTRPGFSTASEVTDLSGRGVGLDVVKRHVESYAGSLEVRSEPGVGTQITLLLPLTLALLDVLLVERGGQVYGVPLASVEEVVSVRDTLSLQGRPALELRGNSIPLADLADLLGATAPPLAEGSPAVIVAGQRKIAVVCDRLLGEEEVLVKSLGPLLANVGGYLGATILGDGRIALLTDPNRLGSARRSRVEARPAGPAERLAPKVLVVEDSFTVRELQRSILEAAGYRVVTARDGKDGLDKLGREEDVALILTDVEMPELDGFQLTESVRANPATASLPIVIVTSLASDDDRRRGIEVGADAYMSKRSFDQQALLETVERLIGR
jgi:two-component system chemotaxis sensor kinase CheA